MFRQNENSDINTALCANDNRWEVLTKRKMETKSDGNINWSGQQNHGHGDLIQAYYGLEIQSNTGRYNKSKTS